MREEISAEGVAAVPQYATKAAECVGTLDRCIQPLDNFGALPIRPYARRLIAECMRLGALDDLADLRLIQTPVQTAKGCGASGHRTEDP